MKLIYGTTAARKRVKAGKEGKGVMMWKKKLREPMILPHSSIGGPPLINFPLENYQNELEEMNNMSRQEYVAHLRRKSSGFSRGASMYRGVTRHHQHGRWQARIGRVAGNKDLYLGTFSTQEEAAEAYDIAAIKFRAVNGVTNFDISRYDVEKIMGSSSLLSGELARRNREMDGGDEAISRKTSTYGADAQEAILKEQKSCESQSEWKMALYQPSQQLDQNARAIETFTTQSCSVASENSIHRQVEDSAKIRTRMSNASSLVNRLCSSGEGSPDKTSFPMFSAMPLSGHLRPSPFLPHMPVFAAWTDA